MLIDCELRLLLCNEALEHSATIRVSLCFKLALEMRDIFEGDKPPHWYLSPPLRAQPNERSSCVAVAHLKGLIPPGPKLIWIARSLTSPGLAAQSS